MIVFLVISLLALVWLVIAGLPFVHMFLSTFKKQFEIYQNGVFAWPEHLYLGNFIAVLKGGFVRYLTNSIIVVLISLFLILFISAFAAYVFSRLKFRFRNSLYSIVVACMAIPIHVSLIPIYIMTQKIGLYDNIFALVGPYVAFNLPLSIFILTGFMMDIPTDIEESAEIDGCSKIMTFFKIILPLSLPGMATLGIYNSVNMWNEFCFALVLTQKATSRTLPLAIWEYQGQYTANITMSMTVLTLTALPMIIAFIIGQDKLVKGMMVGAVKG
jgi:raffinose/stachyose/melibiose transport system permease protein